MKILILGGTGAMGTPLAEILSETVHDVFITSRKHRRAYKNIHFLCGNAKELTFLQNILKTGWDCIVDFMSYTTAEFSERINLFLNACKQYVFISSARVYANSSELLTEDSPRLLDVCNDKAYLSTDEYALSKARQENLLFESTRKNWTIVRPGITYNKDRLQLGVFEKEEWLYLALTQKKIYFSNDIAPHYATLTSGKDVARGIAALLGKESAAGETFHITVDDAILWKDVLKLYKDTLAENGISVSVVMEDTCYRLENEASKYQVIYGRYFDRKFDNGKIKKFIDTDGFVKPKDGLCLCLKAFLENPKFTFPYISFPIAHAIRQYGFRIPLGQIPSIKQKVKYVLIRMNLLSL